jgi:secreted trypsin-like serine protease
MVVDRSSTGAIDWEGEMRKRIVAACLAAVLATVLALPALGITFGEPDGNDHPNVGAIVVEVPDFGEFQWCTGTLIADGVFLTAAHCFDLFPVLEDLGASIRVTFAPDISAGGAAFHEVDEWISHPDYIPFGTGGQSAPNDVGVMRLATWPTAEPADLPTQGLLDQLKADGTLKHTRFTAVGYGTVRDTMTGSFDTISGNTLRNRAEQGFNSLTKAWLKLPMVNTAGNQNGGTCYGDSGGPHFIHLNGEETNIIASITVTGDVPCKATDQTYRMDVASVRDFLGDYVTLP